MNDVRVLDGETPAAVEQTSPKYAVLKWEDWVAILPVLNQSGARFRCDPADMRLIDGEVIRKQDITSGPVFHLYANLIRSFIELSPVMPLARLLGLQEIADHFHAAAMDAEEWPDRKLPD